MARQRENDHAGGCIRGPDDPDRSVKLPLVDQLYDGILAAIADETLQSWDRLLSTRSRAPRRRATVMRPR
ncbi:MAG TPA: hypothetical protein VD767_10905 [Thermomicrobiales bacterium]|nr:hypothetical protein [Thermomicrobiales bacterium]